MLRPGGELRFLEQCTRPRARRGAEAAAGCSTPPSGRGSSAAVTLSRDTAAAIEEAGFTITELERFSFPEGARGPSSAAILGRAVRLSVRIRRRSETQGGPAR